MKSRFNTYDLICSVAELQRLVGLRVNQVYDIDNKTFLIKLQQGDNRAVLLFESGIRIHTTVFEWPKNVAPSGFSMKMRKHIRNKRLEKIAQLGIDRIVDMQFGSGEASYHVILELYDRGNIILTDYNYLILYVLRPHTEGEEIRFAVRERYPLNRGKEREPPLSVDLIKEIFRVSKCDDTLKKILNPNLVYGPELLDHALLSSGFPLGTKLKDIDTEHDVRKIFDAFILAELMIDDAFNAPSKGYIIQKKEKRHDGEYFFSNQEFHPFLFKQHSAGPYVEFDTFDLAVDEFFSKSESQKIDMKGVQQELAALKKLENVKKDHEKRLNQLEIVQEEDKKIAELITRNQQLVDNAIIAVRQLVANQMSWNDISLFVKEATSRGDETAKIIKSLKFNTNHITLLLSDPYVDDEEEDDILKPRLIDVNIDLTAFANAKKYYDQKKQAATKQRKTIESQDKAFKSAEKKTKQTLKEVKTGVTISKARKVYWFEKFFWFISTENYLVIGGRDQQQNELIVKRYLRPNDIYVHAGITGASSIVIKNPSGQPVPPKTLNEAGTMAICYSTAWEAKVVTTCWWVHATQVSKTAPTGEYLTTGSFMIRGKKNFLPQCHLIMGFSFMFKLEESSIERHRGERRKKTLEEEYEEIANEELNNDNSNEMVEYNPSDNDTDDEDGNNNNVDDNNLDSKSTLDTIVEKDEMDTSYPDTEIFIDHHGEKFKIKTRAPGEEVTEEENEEVLVYLGDDEPIIIRPSKKKSTKKVKNSNESGKIVEETRRNNEQGAQNEQIKQQTQLKRGQKGKLKKIKEKYRDQDEEERELRMRILQSDGKKKEDKKKKKGKKGVSIVVKKETSVNQLKQEILETPPVSDIITSTELPLDDENENLEEIEDLNEPIVTADVDMLDSLTGQPMLEDELLFALPVVAPYNTLTNYKYKVKLTPGTGKRGKASKLALSLFLKDKTATQREKNLLKFVKDQDLARNFPGKVKVSAPQLSKRKGGS